MPIAFRSALAAGLGALLAAQALVANAAAPVLDRLRQGGTLVIAHRESSVPFSYLDADKKPVGYAVDICLNLADAVKKELGLKSLPVSFKLVSPANRIAMIEKHEADLECGSTTNNAERREKVAFTVPHYITGARYMVRAESKIEELPQFEGRRLVSTKGTTPLKAISQANRERLLRIEVMEAPDHARAVEMVEKGEADGFAMDDVLLGTALNLPMNYLLRDFWKYPTDVVPF